MIVKDHSKSKEKFVASGVKEQSVFLPMLFPSMNDYIRDAGKLHTPGFRHQRGSVAQSIKNTMETKIQMHLRLAGLQPMEQAYFFFTFYEQNRQRNKDNIQSLAIKFFFDALQKQGTIANDGWKEVMGFDPDFVVTKRNAGMLVKMMDPMQCGPEILNETSMRITKKLHDYRDFRKRTSR